jgi:hypothetical protein
METGFRYQDESELQKAPEQVSTLPAVPVHVIIELTNNRLVTAPNGLFFEGKRALPGGVESNAIAIARRYGLIGTKAVGPLLLTREDREHVSGHAFVLAPTLEVAKAANFKEMGLELHDIDELSHHHKQVHEIAEKQDNPELLQQIRRHSALLRAYGRETLRSL